MADGRVDFLVVGGGVAGFACARTLREEGAEGSIALVSRDPDPPYDRTAVSKGYLQGRTAREETLLAPGGWWDEHGVELLVRTSARRLRVEGADLEGIHYVRALGNADAIRAAAQDSERVVLVGGSYIATEVAASLTTLGRRCALAMQEGVTLERALGAQAGRFF